MYILRQPKIILLVGMMGAGKTSLGRLLSRQLKMPFVDSDKEIEKITGFTISDLFARYGEQEFRKGEERIMERLLNGRPCVLSSGGGAFLSAHTRAVAKEHSVSVWLKAETKVLSRRTQGRKHRPLIPAADNQKVIDRLIQECYPIYEEADIMVQSLQESPFQTVRRLLSALENKKIVEYVEKENKKDKK